MDMKTSRLSILSDPTLLKADALIDGQWIGGNDRFAVNDPATGLKLVDVANLGARATEAALAAAEKAWPAWRNKTAPERGAILGK
jgi:succinate-semialdehyde dehydrogenase/glutarate-semialdehyde dehydrogenase